ncbi:MAG TPA: endonuclease/exonuclease/phosphatase family protein [Anaerolineales bacterium]
MSISQEIVLEAQPRTLAPGFSRLFTMGRLLLALPGLGALHPTLRRVSAVAEPARRLSIRPFPENPAHERGAGITILSANLWHDWPRYRRLEERLDDFSRLVEAHRADIVLLQEVARTPRLRADEWLSKRLGMAYVYSRANGHEQKIGFEEGVAIFSRFPLHQPLLQELGDQRNPFVRRLALGITAETHLGRLKAFSVHLGLARRQNAAQLAHLRSWVAEQAGELPALVGGDFNAREGTSQIRQAQSAWLDPFRRLHPLAAGFTHELHWPWGAVLHRSRLDYIFLRSGARPWQVVEARPIEGPGKPHSDHQAVLVRLLPGFREEPTVQSAD